MRRVFEQGAYADRAFTAEAAGLEPRERAFAMQLSYGTVQRRATLDHVLARFVSRPLGQLDAPLVAALRLGGFQLLFLAGVGEHAAVNESVELAKRSNRGGAGLVNAVLRRTARDGPAILAELDDQEPAGAAILHSVPEWLARMWWRELGAETVRALLRGVNDPAESAIRVNTLVATREEVLARLPVPARPAPDLPEGIVLDGPFDAHGSELFGEGALMPQSRGSMLVSRVLCPRPGERVLDLCAAPGGKTTHLAAIMSNEGSIVAVERHPGRAQALRKTCSRLHASCVQVELSDAAQDRSDGVFDRVLVDPPCSGLGTLRSRPDLRWRGSADGIGELVELQLGILTAGARATARGGMLVYSVCTISRAEGIGLVERFLECNRDWSAEDLGAGQSPTVGAQSGPYLQLLPHRDLTDGFFIAALRRG